MAKLTGAGTEDKKKVAIAAALGVAVLALAIHTLFGGPSATEPPATAPPANLSAAGQSAAMHEAAPAATAESRLDPVLHTGLLAANEDYVYAGSGRNIFAAETGPPPPPVKIEKVTAPVRPSTEIAAAAAPMGPPPIGLKFFGYVAPKGSVPQRAFLLAGDNVFVARVGDIVSHRYRVMQIGPAAVQVQDLAYSDTQSLPLVRN